MRRSLLGLCAALLAACPFEPGVLPPRGDAPMQGSAVDAPVVDMPPPIDMAPPPPDAYVCSTSGLPCVGTATAVTCNGACWVKCTSTFSIPNQFAVDGACAQWGGSLAPIRDAADQLCVSQTLYMNQASWLGLEQNVLAQAVGDDWTNNGDGVALTVTYWGGGQPNDLNGSENAQENCAFMNTAGEWHDTSCFDGSLYRFSCRRN